MLIILLFIPWAICDIFCLFPAYASMRYVIVGLCYAGLFGFGAYYTKKDMVAIRCKSFYYAFSVMLGMSIAFESFEFLKSDPLIVRPLFVIILGIFLQSMFFVSVSLLKREKQ